MNTADARNGPGTVPKSSPISPESKARDFAQIRKMLSVERFESHRRTEVESDDIIFLRHQWNAKISEDFYGPLQVLEVVLRNRLDCAISLKVKNPQWLTEVPPWLRANERNTILKAHQFLIRHNRPTTQARVIQEMSFGFWTSLLNGKYETLFHSIGAAVFPGMPRPIRTRSVASIRFESIRSLRNRIFHFRRIWHRRNLSQDFNEVLEAINWCDPDARRLLLPPDALAKFLQTLAGRP
jgi:hypothetical protein